jgi:predicted nucleic acid-binding Zn ribbon protein
VRRAAPRPVAFAVEAVADSLAPPTLLAAIQRAWPEAAGAFAAHAQPVSERDGQLVVGCESAVWASELDLFSERVLERLNAALGCEAVTRLRPRATGSTSSPGPPRPGPRDPPGP